LRAIPGPGRAPRAYTATAAGSGIADSGTPPASQPSAGAWHRPHSGVSAVLRFRPARSAQYSGGVDRHQGAQEGGGESRAHSCLARGLWGATRLTAELTAMLTTICPSQTPVSGLGRAQSRLWAVQPIGLQNLYAWVRIPPSPPRFTHVTPAGPAGVTIPGFDAEVAESADAADLKSADRKVVGVQISPSAPAGAPNWRSTPT